MNVAKVVKIFLLLFLWLSVGGYKVWAADLIIQNETIADTKNYQSDEGILFSNVVIESTSNVSSLSTYYIVLKHGTHIKKGSRFKAIIKDNDGVSNQCEMLYFGNLDQKPGDDPDGDRLTNAQECLLGTDPTKGNSDNDSDGLPDWWEVKYSGTSLDGLNGKDHDADGDGISNWVEYQLGSDPLQPNEKGPGIHYEYDALGRIIKIWRIPQK